MTRREALWISLGSAAPLWGQGKSQPAVAITNVTVIDGAGGVMRAQTVVVSGDRILEVGAAGGVRVPQGAVQVDGRERFLIPGLCDCHAHLSYFKWSALPVLLANGVTSIRDMGGRLSELDEWATEAKTGIRHGPRVFRAGPIVNGKKFNEFQVAVANADEARGAVRTLAQSGVDFIKVHAAISREAYYGVRDECRILQLPYAGHMPRAITPAEASDAGQVTLEHVGAFADRFESEGVAADALAAALAKFRRCSKNLQQTRPGSPRR